jgi:hypothetical protein
MSIATPKVGSRSIHLVNETDSRNVKAIRLPPDRLGLGLDAVHGIKHDHSTVEHAQAALHLGGKVDVARRIDDVNADGRARSRSPPPTRW